MKNKGLTLTIICKATANYGENLGNIGSVQKSYNKGKVYAMRSKESIKYAIMKQSGLYSDLEVQVDGAAQKAVGENKNASNIRALEGGYMNTGDKNKGTRVRNSSFYVSDAVSVEPLVIDSRFHNNLNMATTFANANDLNVQSDAGKVGLMPYQYEFDNNLKKYSITIDLDMVGTDSNFGTEADATEKAERVKMILTAVSELGLVVRGSLDNAEPLFVVGGIGNRKTHFFENRVNLNKNSIIVDVVKEDLGANYKVGVIKSGIFNNQDEIINELDAKSTTEFFDNLIQEVNEYYGV